MKYLKYFEDKSNDDIISDLEDICAELVDIGFHIEFDTYTSRSTGAYLTIYKRNPKGSGFGDFNVSDITETMERVKEYLGDKWVSDNINRLDSDSSKAVIAEVEFRLSMDNINENIKEIQREDIMWCLVDMFDDYNMVQESDINMEWNSRNEASEYYHLRFSHSNLGNVQYNIWRYNRTNEILVICPLGQDNYKTWHNILPELDHLPSLIKNRLGIDITISCSVYNIGLIKISF